VGWVIASQLYPEAQAIPLRILEVGLRFTVAIPTFERPAYLGRAVRFVPMQTGVPDEVLVVHRPDDGETVMTFDGLLNLPRGNLLRFVAVDEPGFCRQSGKLSKTALAM
jgi:hypothetical protein